MSDSYFRGLSGSARSASKQPLVYVQVAFAWQELHPPPPLHIFHNWPKSYFFFSLTLIKVITFFLLFISDYSVIFKIAVTSSSSSSLLSNQPSSFDPSEPESKSKSPFSLPLSPTLADFLLFSPSHLSTGQSRALTTLPHINLAIILAPPPSEIHTRIKKLPKKAPSKNAIHQTTRKITKQLRQLAKIQHPRKLMGISRKLAFVGIECGTPLFSEHVLYKYRFSYPPSS